MRVLLCATVLAAGLAAANAQIRIVPLGAGATVQGQQLSSISSCGTSSDHASDVEVTLSPPNPQPGKNFTMTSSYTLDEDVTGGKAAYSATLNGVPVVDKTEDLCKSLAGSSTPCPLSKGPHSSSSTSTLPSDVPSGTYAGTVKWTDQNGQPVLCVKFSFET